MAKCCFTLFLAGFLLLCQSGCTREDDDQARRKLHEAGQELKRDTRQASEKLKQGAHEAGQELRKTLTKPSQELKKESQKLKH